MTNYTVITNFRNKEKCIKLINGITDKGRTCYNFFNKPADPRNPDASPEEQMKALESVKDFYNNEHFKYLFEADLSGLKNAEKVILLLPAGTASHIEAGIAYGLGKPLILIGEAEKPDTLYLIFKERYKSIEDFLKTI